MPLGALTTSDRTVALIGAGGNIGSHFVPHVARMTGIERVLLVDPDRYEEKNLRSQEIARRDIDRRKVDVQARRLCDIRPDLDVIPLAVRMEDLPLGRLRCDVIVACLDSRISRQAVNQAAWRLGVPWIDAGVSAGGDLLARINVYRPGESSPCLECAWSDQDYALLEVRHPCQTAAASHSTNAPSMLGSLAASLAAIECRKLLMGDVERSLAGRQVVLDAQHHTHYVTAFRRNPRCRFDHRTWSIELFNRSPRTTKLRDLLDMARNGVLAPWAGASPPRVAAPAAPSNAPSEPESHPVSLRLEGARFLLRPFCANGCSLEAASGRAAEVVGLSERLRAKDRICPKCAAERVIRGWDLADELRLGDLSNRTLRRTLASLGFVEGDVLRLSDGRRDRHLQLGGST